MLALWLALAWPSAVRAYTLQYVDSGAAVRWNVGLVELEIDPALAARAQPMQMAALAAESAAAWYGLANVPEIVIGDGEPGSPGYHGGRSSNGVYWIEDWSHSADALAVTVTTFGTKSGKIVDADVLINAAFSFAPLVPDLTRAGIFDLPGILTHEFGHMLGLRESCEPGATMWPVVAPGETFQRDLAADDRAGAERLYSELSQRRGCNGASVLGRGSRRATGPGYLWGAFALVLAATLRRSARRRARNVRRTLAIAGLLCWSAAAGAEDPPSPAPGDPLACQQLAASDVVTEQRVAKLLDGVARVVTGRATRVEAYERAGLIWTRFHMAEPDCDGVELEVPGGTLGDVTQVVSHHSMPRDGEPLVIGLHDCDARAWAHLRDGAIYGGTLGEGPAVPWPL